MKPLQVGAKLALLTLFTLLVFYIGRPVYWEALAKWRHQAVPPQEPVVVSGVPRDDVRPNTADLVTGSAPVKTLEEDADPENLNLSPPDESSTTDADDAPKVEDEPGPQLRENLGAEEAVSPGASLHELLRKPIWEAPPPGTQVPAKEDFRLTKEMTDFRADRNVIVVTFSNHAFMDFVLNWVKHLTDSNVFNILVGAMDDKILDALFWKGVPVFNMESNMNIVDVGWGSPTFHAMGREKVFLVNKFLSFGFELLMCDTDMVWLQNPLPYIARFPDADVLTSSDEVASTVEDDRLEIWDKTWGAYNIGIVHWRPTAAAKAMALEWQTTLVADDKIWDQNKFNELMIKKKGPSVDKDSGLFYAYDGELKLGILPVSIFCSGHTYFIQALPDKLGLKPYAVHTTFQYAGTPGKRHRLREARLFYDEPAYYDAPGGFLKYSPHIPDELLRYGKHTVESHFNLVNYQLVQIRTALAIASILKRVLVMPKIFCRLDRLWFGHPGVLPNTKTSQPFKCPMDHILEINNMLKDFPEEEFGSPIQFREYSFLHNHRIPKEVKTSVLHVEVCDKGSDECVEKLTNSKQKQLVLFRNSTETQIKQAFEPYKSVKVFDFASIDHAFVGFKGQIKQNKFRRRLNEYTGIWCCVENANPGHIYYDFFWDFKTDWRPLPPKTREDDHRPL